MNKYASESKVGSNLKALKVLHGCQMKKSYESEQNALVGAGDQRVYRCPHCQKWHRASEVSRYMKMTKRGRY